MAVLALAAICCSPPPPPPNWYKPWNLTPPPRTFSSAESYFRRWGMDNVKNTLNIIKENTAEGRIVNSTVTAVQQKTKYTAQPDENIKTDFVIDVFSMRAFAKISYKEFMLYSEKKEGSDWITGFKNGNKHVYYNADRQLISIGYNRRW